MDDSTPANQAPLTPDSPEVKARVDEKRRAEWAKEEAAARAAFAAPVTLGTLTLHPPNTQTLDAISQPEIMRISQARMFVVLAYLISMPPARQIAASDDPVKLRNAAALFQEEHAAGPHWSEIIQHAYKAWNWVQTRMVADTAFFFDQTTN